MSDLKNQYPHTPTGRVAARGDSMKTAILLIGFNRVDYFDQTLSSLEANKIAHDCDLHVYLDGGPNANQEELIARVEASSFVQPTLVARTENWGIGRHLIDARRTLFDQEGYDRVLLFEDDMVLAPSYVETVLKAMDWARAYNDIGTVMAFNINDHSADLQKQQLNQLVATNRHFWGYGMEKTVWDDIKPTLYAFEKKYLESVSYAHRAHRRIRWRLIRPMMKRTRESREGTPLIPSSLLPPPFSMWPLKSPTSQDAITALALWFKGYARITTRVPRATYVGREGFSFSPEVFEQMGFNRANALNVRDLTAPPTSFELATSDLDGQPLKPPRYE